MAEEQKAAEEKRQLRYLAPNSLTAISLTFGLVSLAASHPALYDELRTLYRVDPATFPP